MEKKKTKKKAVKKLPKKNLPAISEGGGLSTMTPQVFKEGLLMEKARSELLKKYISDQLIDGVDYGRIHINKNCNNKRNCNLLAHMTKKPCLFKPGAEKFCNLLKLRAVYEKDEAVLSMIPDEIKLQGVIAFKCNLVSVITEKIITEGHGACTLAEKNGQINTAVKLTEKRSRVDAVLSLGLSDTFTQDEDVIKENAGGSVKPVVKKTEKKTEKDITPKSGKNTEKNLAKFYLDTEEPQNFRLDFGKHKDKTIDEVPSHYWKFLYEGSLDTKSEYYNAKNEKIFSAMIKAVLFRKMEKQCKEKNIELKSISVLIARQFGGGTEYKELSTEQRFSLYDAFGKADSIDFIKTGEETEVKDEPEPTKKEPE